MKSVISIALGLMLLGGIAGAVGEATATVACPTGIVGRAQVGSVVCAQYTDNKMWCARANSKGQFQIAYADKTLSTGTGCLPANGKFYVFAQACPSKGQTINHNQSSGGDWLNLSCGGTGGGKGKGKEL